MYFRCPILRKSYALCSKIDGSNIKALKHLLRANGMHRCY